MKATLKLHPKSQHDMMLLAKVLTMLSVEAEIEAEQKDITGVAHREGQVTQQMIDDANKKYVAPKPTVVEQSKVEQKPLATVTPTPPVQTPEPVVMANAAPTETVAPTAAQQATGDKPVELQDLRAKTQQKILAGFREQVKALLAKYNVPAVTALPEEHWKSYNKEIDAIN